MYDHVIKIVHDDEPTYPADQPGRP